LGNTFRISVVFLSFLICLIFNQTYPQANITDSEYRFFENGKPTQQGPDVGMFAQTSTRLKVDLSGVWQFTMDDKEWRSVQIPSAYDFTGKVKFQRKFEVTTDMLDKYDFSLVCYGINYQAEIQINGNFVGRHIGGYSSFILPIRDKVLQPGKENAIKVEVDNELTVNTTLPLRHFVDGWRNYGGIFRDVYILATPKLSIGETTAKSEISSDYKTVKLSIRSNLENSFFTLSEEELSKKVFTAYTVEVYDKLTEALVGKSALIPFNVLPKKTKEVSLDLPIANPKFWSPEAPDLYTVKCFIVRVDGKTLYTIDEFTFDYGIRDVRLKGNTVLVNGSPIQLKGVMWQESHPFFGSAMTYESIEKDVAIMKTAGVNFIRFLYPPHPYMLNLCDRYGIFVMEEIPFTKVPSEIFEKEFYSELAENYTKEMVIRDRNHTSVLTWGIGNEFEILEETHTKSLKYIETLKSLIKSLDQRPVYFAVSASAIDRNFLAVGSEQIDILAINTETDFDGGITKFRQVLKNIRDYLPNKVLIVGKYGKEIEPGNRNGYTDPFSVESQARFAWQAYDAIKDLKFAGSVLFSFNDWLSDRPSMVTPSRDPYLRTMGMVTYDRQRRVIFDVMRNVFNGEKVTALPIGNYSSSTPIVYVIAGLIVLISLAFFYNSNRRFRENVNRALMRSYNFFADVRDQRIIPVSHSILLSALVAVTMAIISSSIFSHYRYNLLVDDLMSHFLSDGIKSRLVTLIWNPYIFILYVSVLFFLKILIINFVLKFLSLFIRNKVYLYHTYSITVWALLPVILLIPLSMILFRIMDTSVYILPSLGLIIFIMIWSVLRLFKGVSIIFDIVPVKVYTVGILIIIVLVSVVYGYLDYTYSTSLYFKFLIKASSISI
jgi:beta-galactosidase